MKTNTQKPLLKWLFTFSLLICYFSAQAQEEEQFWMILSDSQGVKIYYSIEKTDQGMFLCLKGVNENPEFKLVQFILETAEPDLGQASHNILFEIAGLDQFRLDHSSRAPRNMAESIEIIDLENFTCFLKNLVII